MYVCMQERVLSTYACRFPYVRTLPHPTYRILFYHAMGMFLGLVQARFLYVCSLPHQNETCHGRTLKILTGRLPCAHTLPYHGHIVNICIGRFPCAHNLPYPNMTYI